MGKQYLPCINWLAGFLPSTSMTHTNKGNLASEFGYLRMRTAVTRQEEPLATPGRPKRVPWHVRLGGWWNISEMAGFLFTLLVPFQHLQKGCHMVPKGCQFTIPQCLIGIPLKVYWFGKGFSSRWLSSKKIVLRRHSILCGSHEVVSPTHAIAPNMGWILPDGHPNGDFSETCKDYQRILKCLTV